MHRRAFLRRTAACLGMGASLAMSEPSATPLHADAPPAKQPFEAGQERRRQELWGLLGDLPGRRAPKAKLLKI